MGAVSNVRMQQAVISVRTQQLSVWPSGEEKQSQRVSRRNQKDNKTRETQRFLMPCYVGRRSVNERTGKFDFTLMTGKRNLDGGLRRRKTGHENSVMESM